MKRRADVFDTYESKKYAHADVKEKNGKICLGDFENINDFDS